MGKELQVKVTNHENELIHTERITAN